jgi:hypothetical protein
MTRHKREKERELITGFMGCSPDLENRCELNKKEGNIEVAELRFT